MTHLPGGQLSMAASREPRCGFWPYSHSSLLGVLFVWLEIVECGNGVL